MITIGTDCSGIEAPIQALNNLGINFKHVFSCEINKYARAEIKDNFMPEYLYEDTTTRPDHYVDIYICGFPCQPFSMSGKRLGTSDPRGNIFNSCHLFIEHCRPKVFVLENVKGLLSIDGGKYWSYIRDQLIELEDYNVYHKVLNTKDYGIPQNRERIYIIGLRKDSQIKGFMWPDPVPAAPLKSFIDVTAVHKDPVPVSNLKVYETIINSKATFLNLGWQNFKTTSYEHYTPSIIAQASIWCVPMHRKATITELLTLQGFPKDFKQVVSNTQFKKQIGNAMSVNVLEYVLIEILKCIDFQFLSIPEKYNNSHLNLAK